MLICYQTESLNELQNVLAQSEMVVMQSEGTKSAMASMTQYTPAFLLLDFDMGDAASFLQEVSSSIFFRPAPYILIAATFAQGPDRATVLDLGADACIEKPIDPAEVVALIHAVLRREHKIARLGMGRLLSRIEHKDLTIDPLRRVVTMYGEPVALSPKEFDILHLLAQHAGDVLTPQTIYESVWKSKFEFMNPRIADNIHSIRRKLGLDSKDTDYIETVHRIGYRFASPERIPKPG